MENFSQWFESIWNGLFGTRNTDTGTNMAPVNQSASQVTTNPITAPVDATTGPISVVYDPTPANVTSPPSRLDLWCKAAIEMEGANPANNNPGNIRYVQGTWMQEMSIRDNGGFCVFKDYETGYAVLQKVFTNAATGKSQIYHPTDTLYDFYSKYAPASDNNNPVHYAQFVAGIIGVPPETEISSLV